ncbi:hypothetical protein [Roseivirga sp. E12]|uniref:hypothetical protein n=1 Tax=Roseivirga sp. E12 TaxID=2819237 RepID=UPI001ABCBD39|nr:hypothetical protein [Roseivirga sp. E12]MBO3696839.1 hypothetical protein [Roseivirga sp. E12]
MNRAFHISRHLITFGIPLSLLAILVIFIKSSTFTGGNTIDLAITADLLLTVPLIYLLLIRKTDIPKTTVVPVMVIGLLVGTYFLPKENQTYLMLFKTWALPIIELSVLTFVVFKVRGVIKAYKARKDATPDFFHALKDTCSQIFPRKAVFSIATEVAVFYYGFIHWRTIPLSKNEFSYHKKSGTPALLGALIFIIIIETVVFHYLLISWSSIAAWVLTALSIYSGIQIFGFAKSLSKRPICINEDYLTLKYGILSEVEIPLENIETIELSGRSLDEEGTLTRTLSPLGEMESHNLILHLKHEQTLISLYGIKRQFKVLALHIDEPEDFKNALNNVIVDN